jgi:uncharacterized membrane protein YbhN (UPF0104 family)
MAPHTRIEQLRQFVDPRLARVRAWLDHPAWRLAWRLLAFISLALLAAGTFYAWRQFPTGTLQVAPRYLALAAGIYVVTYGMQAIGWHTLANQFFGRLSLRDNLEGLASSALVKYLPTIAWYIANRAHFYHQRRVPRTSVVAAALAEISIMIGSGSLLYAIYLLGRANLWLACLAALAAVLLILSFVRGDGLLRRWSSGRLAAYLPAGRDRDRHRYGWLVPFAWYGGTWPLGVCFLWAILHTFVPLDLHDLAFLFNVWLLAGLISYIVSSTFGALGIAREVTMSFLLAQVWPLPAAIATSIAVRIVLNLGELGCSAVVLGWLYLSRKRAGDE